MNFFNVLDFGTALRCARQHYFVFKTAFSSVNIGHSPRVSDSIFLILTLYKL